jgi:hypothetical protein
LFHFTLGTHIRFLLQTLISNSAQSTPVSVIFAQDSNQWNNKTMTPDEFANLDIKAESLLIAQDINSRHNLNRIQLLELLAQTYAHMLGTTLMTVSTNTRSSHQKAILDSIDNWTSERVAALEALSDKKPKTLS